MESGRWESGKPDFGFPLSHPPSSSAQWKCGNPAGCWRDFQGARGKRGKPAFGFPRFPQHRHFHGACFSWFAATPQQFQLVFLHPPRCLRVAHFRCLSLQHLRCDPILQALLPGRQRLELLVWSPIVLVAVRPFALASAVDRDRGIAARTMEVQLRIEMRRVEFLHRFGVLGRDCSIADLLSHHGSILPFYQGIVRAAVGPRFGELLHQQFV